MDLFFSKKPLYTLIYNAGRQYLPPPLTRKSKLFIHFNPFPVRRAKKTQKIYLILIQNLVLFKRSNIFLSKYLSGIMIIPLYPYRAVYISTFPFRYSLKETFTRSLRLFCCMSNFFKILRSRKSPPQGVYQSTETSFQKEFCFHHFSIHRLMHFRTVYLTYNVTLEEIHYNVTLM